MIVGDIKTEGVSMLKKEMIITLLESIHEHKMAKDIFVPMLKNMNLKGVRYTGGDDEQGIDIEYYELTEPDRQKSYVGIQFKKGNITYGATGGKGTVKEIKNQAEEAFIKEIHDIEGKGVRYISRFIVATTGDINEPARKYIGRARNKGEDTRIDYWTGDRLAEYIQQNWMSQFEEYFKEEILSTPIATIEEQIVDIDYIESNYEKLVRQCRRIKTTVSPFELSILKALAKNDGELSIGNLLYEIEETEDYIKDDLIHLRDIEYLDIDGEEHCVNICGKARQLTELYNNIAEEINEADENTDEINTIFDEILK